jgi:hypothetical protein
LPVQHRIVLVTVFLLILLPFIAHVNAVGGPVITAVLGSNVTIDGTLQPGEWSDATHLNIVWQGSNSSLTGPASLYLKNNGTNLLIAASANGTTIQGTSSNVYTYTLALLFNDKNNGTVNNYDPAKTLTYTTSGNSWIYSDQHYDTSQGKYVPDASPNGTAAGSFSNYGGAGTWTWEFSIPMTSSNAESFNLTVEDTIGFDIMFTETHSLNNGAQIINDYSYWPMEYATAGPTGTNPPANEWASISRSSSPITNTTPPAISNPTATPSNPSPSQNVTITTTVTDANSAVYSVLIYYTTDNWKTVNNTIAADYNTTSHVATGTIPAEPGGTHVQYYIVAYDYSFNRGINNNNGSRYSYNVALSSTLNTSGFLVIGLIFAAMVGMATIIAIHAGRARRAARASFRKELEN